MQALEKIGVLEQDEDKGGRRITQSGRRDLDRMFPLSSGLSSGMHGEIRASLEVANGRIYARDQLTIDLNRNCANYNRSRRRRGRRVNYRSNFFNIVLCHY